MKPTDDRDLVEAIDRSFRPEPMDPIRAAAFRRRLEERLARRPLASRLRFPAVAATAAVATAMAVWLALPLEPRTTNGEENGLSAFVDPDATADRSDDYLPEDYVVLASLLELEPEPEEL
jgi:hypothetical protein